jgi:hypothetical protein
MKMTVFWDIVPCSLDEEDRRFIFAMMMKAVRTSETSVHFKETTRCYIPEDCHLHTSHRENLQSHTTRIHNNKNLQALRWRGGIAPTHSWLRH